MTTNKTIINLQKQNDSIYQNLCSKNILFDRISIDGVTDETELLKLLNDENSKLKEIIKSIKPIQPIQQVTPKIKQEQTTQISKKKNIDDEEDEETYDEPVKKFNTITNMEDIKRAFFNGEYETVEEQLKTFPFKYYKVNYKYNSDKDGAPEYLATNLLKGFVRSFDDYRKYFLICFRCWKLNNNTYSYDSYWIVNSEEPISNILDSIYDDFDFQEITDTNINLFFNHIKKKFFMDSDETVYADDLQTILIGENYVH